MMISGAGAARARHAQQVGGGSAAKMRARRRPGSASSAPSLKGGRTDGVSYRSKRRGMQTYIRVHIATQGISHDEMRNMPRGAAFVRVCVRGEQEHAQLTAQLTGLAFRLPDRLCVASICEDQRMTYVY